MNKRIFLFVILVISISFVITACTGNFVAKEQLSPYYLAIGEHQVKLTGNQTNTTHKICFKEDCIKVNGPGANECQEDYQCKANNSETIKISDGRDGNQTNTCTDTDGGINYPVQGTVYGMNSSGLNYSHTDSCSGGGEILEYYCNGNVYALIWSNCTNLSYQGCSSGACYGTNQTNVTHKECVGQICKTIQGAGTDECLENWQCLGNNTDYTCTDTDSSTYPTRNYFVKGTATVINTSNISYSLTDSCATEAWIINERYCQSANSNSIFLDANVCPNGYYCSNGACINGTTNHTDFFTEFVSLQPTHPLLWQTAYLTYRYGNNGPSGGYASRTIVTHTPIGGSGAGSNPQWFEAGEVKTGIQSITLSDGEGWYGFYVGINPLVPGIETNRNNNNLTVDFYVQLGNCTQYNGTICRSGYTCSGSWIHAANTDRCCLGTCKKKKQIVETMLEFFSSETKKAQGYTEVSDGVYLSKDNKKIIMDDYSDVNIIDTNTIGKAGHLMNWNCHCPNGGPEACSVTHSGGGYDCTGNCFPNISNRDCIWTTSSISSSVSHTG